MKKSIKILLMILISLSMILTSCSSMSKIFSKDNSTKDTKTEIIETTKKGGVTTLVVPNIIYKDTTITSFNYETKTMLRSTFDKEGNQKIDCLEEQINQRITKIEEKQKNDIYSESINKKEFNPQQLIYAIIGLAVVLVIGMILFFFIIMNIKKSIPSIISDTVR